MQRKEKFGEIFFCSGKRGETAGAGRKWPKRGDGPDTEVFHVVEMLRLFLLMLLLSLFVYVVVVAVLFLWLLFCSYCYF